ncbi:MAG: response regulator transcription factor [Chitinophagaceae bacterium]|nr:response regulator transcription factor [Chitinophagaceae bacterium]
MESKGKSILIADDEQDILEILEYNLTAEGFSVIKAKNGNEALDMTRLHHPDLLILDVMMPGKTGMEVCQILRFQPEFSGTLIIMLTALSDESNHIKGLEMGADDYISKPISPKVLISRVNALMRRTFKSDESVIKIGDLMIDKEQYVVRYKGSDIILAKKEFELLALLGSKPGRVFLRNEILSQVWGNNVIVGDRTIDVHIRKIRQKLNVDCITTVKGVGYKFELNPSS